MVGVMSLTETLVPGARAVQCPSFAFGTVNGWNSNIRLRTHPPRSQTALPSSQLNYTHHKCRNHVLAGLRSQGDEGMAPIHAWPS